jgi:hypothetical protein
MKNQNEKNIEMQQSDEQTIQPQKKAWVKPEMKTMEVMNIFGVPGSDADGYGS